MQLTWYGTAALILQEEETTIAFDPFCGIPAHPYGQTFRKASHVFITHGHFDHICQIPQLYQKLPVTIYGTTTPLNTLSKRGRLKDRLFRIAPGSQISCGPFTITAYQGRHCRFDLPLVAHTFFRPYLWQHPLLLLRLLALNVSYREKGEILFYEVACHRLRVQIMGSMNLDENIRYPTGADILILPLQGRSDQNTYALRFVKRLKPRIVLLDHCDDTFPPLSSEIDTSDFIRNVEHQLHIPCYPLKIGKSENLCRLLRQNGDYYEKTTKKTMG